MCASSALIAPFGLFDDKEPAADPWAQRRDNLPGLMCADGAKWTALVAPPEGANSVEWPIEMTRASEAAARAFWPLGNTRLEKRLGLIAAPTLILWGERDAVLPPSLCEKVRRRHQRLDQGADGGRCRPSRLSRPARRGGPRRPGTFCLITFVLDRGFEVASAVRIAIVRRVEVLRGTGR